MAIRALSRAKIPNFSPSILRILAKPSHQSSLFHPQDLIRESHPSEPIFELRHLYYDGRPRGPLWRGMKMIGKEALFVILGLKRVKDDEEKLEKFVKSHVLRLFKMDTIAVLNELQRHEEVDLCSRILQKEDWYKPDVFMYKDLIIALAKSKRMEEVMQVWENMRKEELFPDSQTYAEVIWGFLRHGSPADAMNIYEDMKKSPEPPKELPFRILLKGLLPHPLLRNKVKQESEELFPERHIHDPPAEIFGISWGILKELRLC